MKNMNKLKIGKNYISENHKTYFIADIAANHDGSLTRAKKLIHLAAKAGANAAKFQNFFAKNFISDYGFKNLGNKKSHQSKWKKSIYDVYKDAETPIYWTKELKKTCKKAGIDYMDSEYSLENKQEIYDNKDPVLLDDRTVWKDPRGDIYDYTGQTGMQRVVEITPPKEVLE